MVVLILKKIIAFILVCAALCRPVYALDCGAEAAVLYQPDTGTVIFEKNKDARMDIASTTKIMTALVVLENADIDEIVEIKQEYTGIEGSSMYLKAGERFTVKELLTGLLLASGNDAACALACHVAGSIDGFAALMNEKAAGLGLENTHFTNPHGLCQEGHYSSAYDLALIMSEAMNNEVFAEITAEKSANIAGRVMENHNKLLTLDDTMEGGKTGYTKKSGRTLVSSCNREYRLICVTLNCRDDWNEHLALYDAGYSQYELLSFDNVYELPVIAGESDSINAVCRHEPLLVRSGSVDSVCVALPKFVYAPINIGDKLGKITARMIDGKTVCADIVSDCEVKTDLSQKLAGFDKFLRMLGLLKARVCGG